MERSRIMPLNEGALSPGETGRAPRSRLFVRAVGLVLFFALLALVTRLFPGHTRWTFAIAAVGAYGAVTLLPRLAADIRRHHGERTPPQ
jgi:hypothetical protein